MKHLFVLLQRSGVGLLNFALLLALCALAAKWTWVFLAPATVAASQEPAAMPRQPANAIIADHLLTAKVAMERPPSNIKLEGVFAVEGANQGIAILQTTGEAMMVPLKGLVSPGMTLDAIYKDHVVLNRDGAKARLNLQESAPAADVEMR